MQDTQAYALEQAIAALEAQRKALGDAVVDAALRPLRNRLAAIQMVAAVDEPAEGWAEAPSRKLRQVTILFVDLVGSTDLIQHLDPEDVQAVIDGALSAFAVLVRQHGGEVLRYAGDGLKAAFGAEKAGDNDAERAVACGLALLQEAGRRGRAVQREHGLAGLDARVGIHTGPVVRGGGVERQNSLSGLAVHIAARMEQAALAGTLRISMDAYRQVQSVVHVQEQPPLQVKGLDVPMRTFVVQGLRQRHLRGLRHGTDGAITAMVGREQELAGLHEAARAVLAPGSTVRAITVMGDAGLGKSRLLAEFQATWPPGLRSAAVWRAGSQPQGRDQPYGLLRDLLFWHVGVRDSHTQQQAQQAFAAALQPVFGDAADEQIALLGQLIGLDYSASPFIAGILPDGAQRRARGLNAWLRCLTLHAAQQPLVLLLDDLQWADDASLDALDHVATASAPLPMLLLCAARPSLLERRPHWAAHWPAHQCVQVAPLSAQGCDALADGLLNRFARPDTELRALLTRQSAGNPYYMEALLQMLVDTGAASVKAGGWALQRSLLQAHQVPSTLVGVLQAILDALDPRELRSLQQASVVGAYFWDDALAAIDPTATKDLPALSRRELALPQAQSAFMDAQEYAFRHHLLHQVTYDTVLRSDKRLAHARAARWLQRRSQGRESELASHIAEHFERADEKSQAVDYWLLAAEGALPLEADPSALRHADRALNLDDGSDLRRRLRLHRVRADVYRRNGDGAAHEQELTAMESLAERIDDDVLRLSVAFERAWRLSLQARFAESIELARQRLASAPGGSPKDAARLHGLIYVGLARMGRSDEAMTHARQGIALAHAAGDLPTVGQIHTNVGVLEMDANRVGVALAHHQQAMAAYQAAGSRSGMNTARINQAHVQATLGDVAGARDLLRLTIEDCRETGNRRMEAAAQANISGLLTELGDGESAYAAAQEALRLAAVSGDSRASAWAHNGAQYAAHAMGQFELALQHARLAEEGLRAHSASAVAWINAAAAALNLLALGRVDETRDAAEALLVEIDAGDGWDDAFELAYLLHEALAPLSHPRAAELLNKAYHALSAHADKMAAHVPREAFMRSLALHRAICKLWDDRATGRATAPGSSEVTVHARMTPTPLH
jgi:class 3 adenylate cyclase